MLRDMLYEESASSNRANAESKFYTLFLVVSIICFAIGGITAFFATSVLSTVATDPSYTTMGKVIMFVGWILFILAFLGAGVLFWFIKKKFNVSYDYTFVEDELRVTKVFNGRSRKQITVISVQSILKIGYCEKPSFADVMRGLHGKPCYLTPNKTPADGKMWIYVLVSGTLDKTLYIIECKQMLLEYLVQTAGVNKFERG